MSVCVGSAIANYGDEFESTSTEFGEIEFDDAALRGLQFVRHIETKSGLRYINRVRFDGEIAGQRHVGAHAQHGSFGATTLLGSRTFVRPFALIARLRTR